jgi:hypothetical protein
LPRDVSAFDERVGVAGRDQDVTLEELIRAQCRNAHRAHESELDKNKDIREGDACQSGGEPPALVDKLKPAYRQSAQ